ncbi:hypothetical protein RR48_00003 [Papilio machaon]|uniref:Uncharacterized protein n=1 Tax=Papilio machaon TaxID=76193 RepID=A0A0N1ICX0_PAPMA|nr:hypothetical protein RR48_00003 [Papilio machaon]
MHESINLTPLTKLSISQLDPLNVNIENPLMDTEDIQPMTFVKLESSENVEDFLLNATPLESEDCDLDLKVCFYKSHKLDLS